MPKLLKTTHQETIELLTDLVRHLEEAPLYRGSLIFEEDAPAIDVLKRFLQKIKREDSTEDYAHPGTLREHSNITGPTEESRYRALYHHPSQATPAKPPSVEPTTPTTQTNPIDHDTNPHNL